LEYDGIRESLEGGNKVNCSKATISVFLAFSLLLTAGCNLTVQLGGKDNKSEQKTQTLSQMEPESSTPAAQPTPQESSAATISELEERARLAEERARIAEEQLRSQKVEPEVKPDVDAEDSVDTRQTQHVNRYRVPRQSYQTEYYGPPVSYSQPQQYSPPPPQPTPAPAPVAQPQPVRSSQPVEVYNFPQPRILHPISSSTSQVYRSDGQTQESRKGHSTRNKILIGAGLAGAATLGFLLGKKH
jgi:hypothetical protein